MKVEKTKSIDQLYNEVKDYDLVLTAEASLADALNNRLEEPVLGHFATTPMLYVLSNYQNKKLAKEKELFIELVQETEFSWKKSSYLLGNLLESWKNQGRPDTITEYSVLDDSDVRKVLRVVEGTENVYSKMQSFEMENKKVAVVNPHQFNELDRQVVPDSVDEIKVFEDGEQELDKFKIYSSTTEIIRALKENINRENADDVAIVSKTDGKYTYLAKSALREKGVPYLDQKDLSESQDLRLFLRILTLGLSQERLCVKDCRPVFQAFDKEKFDKEVPVDKDNEFLQDLETDLGEFGDLLDDLSELSVGEAIDRFEKLNGNCDELRQNLEILGLLSEIVSRKTLRHLEYYLDTYSVDSEGSSEGVLFVSPHSGAYVDKPVVFYLGMDSSWTANVNDREWIDRESQEETNMKDFKALIQNGEQQHYLVQDRLMNEDVTPCLYFNSLADGEFESFTDAPHEFYQNSSTNDESGFEKEDVDAEVRVEEAVSASTLDKLVECPRQCLFNWIVDDPDQTYFRKGDLLHDFAEFYINYPEKIEEEGDDKIVEIMKNQMKPLVDDLKMDVLENEFQVGIRNLKMYLDNQEFKEEDLDGFTDAPNDNFFAEYYGKEIKSGLTEVKFRNKDIKVKGKTDLIPNPEQLVDFKSSNREGGKNSSASKIVGNSGREPREPNYQAKLYLTALRAANPGEKLKFTFFRFLSNIGDEMSDGEAIQEDNLVTVNYFPGDLNSATHTEEAFEFMAGKNIRDRLLDRLGREEYRRVMQELHIPEEAQDSKDKIEEECLDEMAELCKKEDRVNIARGDAGLTENQLEKSCRSLLRKFLGRGGFKSKNYFKQDIDEFEEFLAEQLENLNEYKKTEFPVGDTDPEETSYQELIIK